jgi:hypothetical protein
MSSLNRIASGLATAAIAVATVGTPALAASSTTHWSKSACQSYQKSFVKKNPHASKAKKAEGNKVLKGHACTVRIK